MRLLPFGRPDLDDALDPNLASLFADGASHLDPQPFALDRAQAKVASSLSQSEAGGGGLLRRLAFGALGGGALWATVAGTAAAHKAVAVAVVGALLLGGGVATESTGVGESVREAIGLERAIQALTGGEPNAHDQSATNEGDAEAVDASTPGASQLSTPGAAVVVEPAPADLPGQLHTVVRSQGTFSMRAVLRGYSADGVQLTVAAEQDPIWLPLGLEAVLQIPGAPTEAEGTDQLSAYVDRLVTVRGECPEGVESLTEDSGCTITRLHVLGGAAGADASEGEVEGASSEGGPGNGNGKPAGKEPKSEDASADSAASGSNGDASGPPEHANAGGNPKDKGDEDDEDD